jgi:hypothetical protein
MTDIEISSQAAGAVTSYGNDAMDRLGRWVQQADAVFALADRICSTSFAPAAYRGKPAEAAAAMLAGAELGFDPMASLRAFDNIQGVPAPKAITLRAVVQGMGHEVEIVESTAERAVVRGRRFGRGEWQTSVWDHPRAALMPQYEKNPNYRQNPAAMLTARATAEVCRWIAADAIMGMPYASEEIEDQPGLAPSPVVRRLTVADLDAPPAIEQASPAKPRTESQKKRMFKLWADLGFGTPADRPTRLELTSKFVGREIQSSDDLTLDEAAVVIARQEARKAELDARAAAEAPSGDQ